KEIVPGAAVQTIAIDVKFVHLIDQGGGQSVDLTQDIGNGRIALTQQSLEGAVADKGGDILLVREDIEEAPVGDRRHSGKRIGGILLDKQIASPDEHLDLPRRIFKAMDLDAVCQFVQQLTALVPKIVRALATHLDEADLAVQVGDLRSEIVHLRDCLRHLCVEIFAKLREVVRRF